MLILKKIIFALFLALFASALCPRAEAAGAPEISAARAIVMHSGGEAVYEKDADAPSLIASTTKLMTAIVALENASLTDRVEIRPEWCGLEGSSMYLAPGQSYSVEELLTGLLLASGNDAALALACHTAGSEEAFVALMNDKAAQLGMGHTHYVNPHGLNAEGHGSTARDLALLMDYCMKNDDFARICGLRHARAGEQDLYNHNKLLDRCPGCIGGKTGYTELAGRCLVSCCEREGTRFICVTLSAPDDWEDHMKLYDWAFSLYSDRDLTGELTYQVPVASGTVESVPVKAEELQLFLPKTAQVELKCELPWFVFAPVQAGDTAGTVRAYLNGELVGQARLVYAGSAALASPANDLLNRIVRAAA